MCTLRLYNERDAKTMRSLFDDPEVMRYVGNGKVRDDPDDARLAFILNLYRTDQAFFVWAVEEDGEYAGHAELKRQKGRAEYEVIYVLRRRCWGRGLGKAVLDLLIQDARRKAIPFVVATVHAENAPSLSILRSRGFVRDDALSLELDDEVLRLDLIAASEGVVLG